jgi:dipeptidyl aminopeptidase/acylaminoacyl peptidase
MRILCLFAFAAIAAGEITHESIWLLKRVGAPSLSPDGKWAIFSVTQPAYDEKEQASDLWIVATGGSSAPRKLTSTKAPESGTAWSPDGKKIAFSTRREGDDTAQVYVLNVTGGEAERLTNEKGGASSPQFSPDGKSILFVSTVKPDRPTPKYQARVYESFPVRYWDRWLDDSQPHLFVQALDGGPARDLLAGTKLAAMPGFGGTLGDTGLQLSAAWSPDSQQIVFAATTNRNEAAFANVISDLFAVSASGGEPRRLTGSKTDSYSRPVFRPDGKALCALHQKEGEKAYSLTRIAMFSWPNPGERTIVSSGLDRSVSDFAFSADSKSIYLTADDAGLAKIFTLPAAGGGARVLFESEKGSYAGIDSQSGVTVAAYDSATAPAEIVRIDGKGHTALTHFNDAAAAKMALPPLRHFWFTSAKGRRIHNLVALPPGFDESKKYPLFVLIHGGPHSNFKDQFFLRWNFHLIAQPGYVVLMPNYTGSTGFGEAFAQAIQGDPLKTPADEINQAADEAIKRFPFIDGARQCAGGASYGGHLSNWLQATTTRYKCLVSHAGLINLESQWGTSDGIYHREVNMGGPPWEQGPVWREQNPIRFAAKFQTPVLVTVGERDFRVPLNNTLEYWSALQRMKVPSKLIVFPRANHWILNGEDSRFFYQELHAWLKKHLN